MHLFKIDNVVPTKKLKSLSLSLSLSIENLIFRHNMMQNDFFEALQIWECKRKVYFSGEKFSLFQISIALKKDRSFKNFVPNFRYGNVY